MLGIAGLGFLVFLITAIASLEIQEAPVDYSGFKVVNALFNTQKQIEVLVQLRDNHVVDFWNEPTVDVGRVMIQITPVFLDNVESILKKEGIEFTTAFEDLQKAIIKEREDNRPSPSEYATRGVSAFNFTKYHSLQEIYDFLADVETEYRHLAQRVTIGNTTEGRPITGIRISAAAPGTRPVIFIECGIHAREWVSPATALHIIRDLTAQNDTTVKTLLSTYEFYIFPSTNPDGYVYTQINRGWRKTRSRSKVGIGCIGADANRNYDTNFCGVGSSRQPCSDTYCGDFAFSEPETIALRNISLTIGSRMKGYFSIHSYSQLWMYPYGYTTNLPPNFSMLAHVTRTGVNALSAMYGTKYRYGPIATTIYQASGSSIDWIYDTVGCKMAFALELRDTGNFGFLLPANQILPTAKETWAGLKAAILAIR